MPDKVIIAQLAEAALIISGALLLWRYGFSSNARARSRLPWPLPHWDIPGYVFALSLIRVLGVAFLFQLFVSSLVRSSSAQNVPDAGTSFLLSGAALHVGLLLGLAVGWFFLKSNRVQAHIRASMTDGPKPPPPLPASRIPLAGLGTFAAIMAAIVPLIFIMPWLLEMLGVPVAPQDAVKFFAEADSPAEIALLLAFAVIVAPITEEFLFRMCLFRYLRGRVPRLIAFVAPAIVFAFAHTSAVAFLPMIVFAIIQSLAYERTNRIAVPMIAHSLFNLHTAVFLLWQVDPYEAVRAGL